MEPTAFFDFPSRGKANFRWFLVFPRGGKPIFADFWFSPVEESRFSLISCFPSRGKAVFRWFLIFPREGKPIFGDFWFSPMRESWFSQIFDFPSWKKADFCPSYPYEAWFFIFSAHRRGYEALFYAFFINRTPTKASFFCFSLIVSRIWTNFPENW